MNRVASFASHHEAELVAGFLRDQGITAVTRSDDASGWEPGLTFVNSVHLYVSPEDVDRARAALRGLDEIEGG
jgi:selenocysteine lyase/cysteine desulfurase